MGKKIITFDEFVRRSILIHGSKYDYSLAKNEYKNLNSKITLICNNCNNKFIQKAQKHCLGHGCKQCNILQRSKKRIFSFDDFILKSKKVHGEKYDYEKAKEYYINVNNYVPILCKKCNKYFWQRPICHYNGNGCKSCSLLTLKKKMTKGFNHFLLKAKELHGNKYDYSLAEKEYVNTKTQITIHCNLCNQNFKQKPNTHLNGCGCPFCGYVNRIKNREKYDFKHCKECASTCNTKVEFKLGRAHV